MYIKDYAERRMTSSSLEERYDEIDKKLTRLYRNLEIEVQTEEKHRECFRRVRSAALMWPGAFSKFTPKVRTTIVERLDQAREATPEKGPTWLSM